jgi:hypothetical protein
MEPTQSSETSAFNTQTPGKYPEDNFSYMWQFIVHILLGILLLFLSLVTLTCIKYIYINYTVETFGNTCQVLDHLVCAVSRLGIAISHLVNVFPYLV